MGLLRLTIYPRPFSFMLYLRLPSSSLVPQVISNFQRFRKKLKLMITGFGQPMSWHDNVVIPKGHRMPMKEALQVVSEGIFFKLALPNWALIFTKRLRTIKMAFEELKVQIIMFHGYTQAFEHHHPIDVYVRNDRGAAKFPERTAPRPLQQLVGGQRRVT